MRESSAGRRRGVQTNGAVRCSTAAPQAAPSWAAGASRRLRAEGGRGRGLRQAAGVRGGQGAEPSASRRRGAGRTRTREATSCPPILRGGEARERSEVSGPAAGVRPGRRGRAGRAMAEPGASGAPRLHRGGRGEVAPGAGRPGFLRLPPSAGARMLHRRLSGWLPGGRGLRGKWPLRSEPTGPQGVLPGQHYAC